MPTDDRPDDDSDGERRRGTIELTVTREVAATVLRDLGGGVDASAVHVGEGDDSVEATVADELDLVVELERDEEEVELEVELTWPRDAAVSAGAPADDAAGEASGPATDDPGGASPGAAGPPTTDSADETDGPRTGTADEDDGGSAVTDLPAGAASARSSLARFEVFRDRGGEWRWRLVHRNGNVVATSGEGYGRRRDARRGMESVMANATGADVVDEADEGGD
jgi:amphi-Trp domain-containing protein